MRTAKRLGRMILDRFDNFLIDCDGVLWRQNQAIPGSERAIKTLLSHKKRVIFVSNNCGLTLSQFQLAFSSLLNLPNIPDNHVFTSGTAVGTYLKKRRKPGEKVFLVGTPGLKLTLSEFGIETLGVQGPVGFKPVETWKDFDVDKSVKYVVVSFDPDFNHTKLTEAYLYLKENNAEFIVPDSDCYFSVATGRKVPGTMSCIAPVQTAIRRDPLILGKPSTSLFSLIQQEHGALDLTRTIMIGDNYNTDMEFGFNCGVGTGLVLSGATSEGQVEGLGRRPDFVWGCLGDMVPEDGGI